VGAGERSFPAVSVAVSTYRRASSLPELIAALEAQTLPRDRFEVVIVDDGSPDETATVLDRLQRTSPLTIRTIHTGTNQGAAAGRNRAWREARAPIVAFTDDDCRPQPTWLQSGLEAMGESKVVVGRTQPPPEQEVLTAQPFSRVLRVEEARFFETANVFYRRADLEAVGGFDESFRTSCEDTDLALRIVPDGQGVSFVPGALVYHDVRPSDFVAAFRETTRWVDVPHVIGRHPDRRAQLLHRRYFWRRSHPTVLLALAGLLLAGMRRSPWALALVGPWVHHRVRVEPLTYGPRRRWMVLPAAFVLDVFEVVVMVQGSVRHRALVL
jgi:GT2 family glycosyltransferase